MTRDSATSTSDDTTAWPPRFRWLKRFFLAGLVLIIAMTAARGWWGWEAQRRINSLVAEAHAEGKPILLEDFITRGVPDKDNAAIPLKQAETSLKWTSDDAALYSSIDLDLDAQLQKYGASITVNHRAEMRLLREARFRKDAEWGFRFQRPLYAFYLKFEAAHRLSCLLQWSALYEHGSGNDAEAIDHLRDCIALGNAESCKAPIFSSIVVAKDIYSCCTKVIVDSPSPFTIGFPTSTSGGGADRDQVRSLILALLDERMFRAAVELAAAGEAMIALETARDLPAVEVEPRILAPLINPMFALQGETTARQDLSFADAIKQSNYKLARSILLSEEDFSRASALHSLVRYNTMSGHFGRFMRFVFTSLAERRIAATMLALQLYWYDHGRKFPATLSELAPQYLPEVPRDPFRADGGWLGYLPDRDPPAIYSVGYDGIDNGGSAQPFYAGYTNRWDARDAVFSLPKPMTYEYSIP